MWFNGKIAIRGLDKIFFPSRFISFAILVCSLKSPTCSITEFEKQGEIAYL